MAGKEAGLLPKDNRGNRVYGLQVNKETGVANLDRHSLCRGQSSGHTHSEWRKLWRIDSTHTDCQHLRLVPPPKVLLCLYISPQGKCVNAFFHGSGALESLPWLAHGNTCSPGLCSLGIVSVPHIEEIRL